MAAICLLLAKINWFANDATFTDEHDRSSIRRFPSPIRPSAIVIARLIGVEIRLVFGTQPHQPEREAEEFEIGPKIGQFVHHRFRFEAMTCVREPLMRKAQKHARISVTIPEPQRQKIGPQRAGLGRTGRETT